MVLPRPAAFRLPLAARLSRPIHRARKSPVWHRTGQQSSRRGYASGNSDHTKQASSDLPWAIGAIVVAVPGTWYLLPSSKGSHGGHEDHGSHEKGDQHVEVKEETIEEPEATSEQEPEQKEEDEDKESEGEPKQEQSSEESQEEKPSTEDSKEPSSSDTIQENSESMKSKQSKLANTATLHPENPDGDPSKSKKGEGVAETAKVEGTVDPNRSQA